MSAPILGDPGYITIRSATPRDPVKWEQGAVRDAVKLASTATDRFGGVDSKEIRGGTLLAKIAATGKYTSFFGADVASAVAIGSIIIYVGTTYIGRFAVGDNVKTSANTPLAILLNSEQDLGAILSVYPTSGTFAYTTGAVSAIAVGHSVWVEPATADGSGDPVAVLVENALLRNRAGSAIEPKPAILRSGYVRTSMLLGLCGRAKLVVAGHGVAQPLGVIVCD